MLIHQSIHSGKLMTVCERSASKYTKSEDENNNESNNNSNDNSDDGREDKDDNESQDESESDAESLSDGSSGTPQPRTICELRRRGAIRYRKTSR